MSFTEHADYDGAGLAELTRCVPYKLEEALPWKERRPLVWG